MSEVLLYVLLIHSGTERNILITLSVEEAAERKTYSAKFNEMFGSD